MRVLLVPFHDGGVAHAIPLMALQRRLGDTCETTFLLPATGHDAFRTAGLRVLDIDHDGSLRTELAAYRLFAPDVVLDDNSLSTGFASTLARLPRVTVQRTGTFPGRSPRVPAQRHSLGIELSRLPDVTALGLPQPHSVADLFRADAYIVAGVPSIEVLPESLRHDPSWFFAGPLFMDDQLISFDHGTARTDAAALDDFSALTRFFAAQAGRATVLVTMGTVARAAAGLHEAMRVLLAEGHALVTTIELDLGGDSAERCFQARYLPLDFVCQRVHLAVHQSGCGTYHYPLLHGVPAITVGTGCHDREDVAWRLEELGLSVHLPSPDDCSDFPTRLLASARRLMGSTDPARSQAFARVRAELASVGAAFDIQAVLRHAQRAHRAARVASARPPVSWSRR